MKDKFCVSKTLVYLVTLVLAVVGTFYLTNYANNQTLGLDPNAMAPKPKSCIYAQQEVTNNSAPYKWVSTNKDGKAYKCIVNANGGNTGARCKTDTQGNINMSGSVRDTSVCPLPSKARTDCMYNGKKLSEYNPAYKSVSDCVVTDKNAWTGYYCNPTTKLSQYNLTKCPRPTAGPRAACVYNGVAATVGVDNCITYNGAWTGYFCDPTTKKNTYNLTKCPQAGRTSCIYAGQKATVDANSCITDGTAWTGYYCNPTTFKNSYDTTKCPPPGPAKKTECFYANAPVAGSARYAMDGNCITDKSNGGYNNGYYCDPATFQNSYDLNKCPTN